MASFNLTLAGEGVADEIRAAFESTVNALRDETTTPSGNVTIDGVVYDSGDVPEAEDFTDVDGGDEPDTTDETDAPVEPAQP